MEGKGVGGEKVMEGVGRGWGKEVIFLHYHIIVIVVLEMSS